MKRSPLVVVAALALAVALSRDAWATCNAIPDAESAMTAGAAAVQAQNPEAKIPPLKRDVIGFKGALGRMDRPYLIPGQTTGFRIQPDGQCVHSTERGLTVRKVPGLRAVEDPSMVREVPGAKSERAPSDYVVSLLTQPARGEGVQALVLASEQVCDVLDTGVGHRVRERGGQLRCVPLAPKEVHPADGPSHVQVRLPDDRKLYGDDETGLRGPVKVVLTKDLPNPAEYLTLISTIAAEGCAAHCDALVGVGASGCVDRFYLVLENGDVIHDKIPCEVTAVPSYVAKNVFKAQCEDLNPAPADLAHCDNDPTGALQLWEDSCGGVHVPFDWTEIRKTTSTPSTDITRVVAGRSATSRTEAGKPDSPRIWIPGREFLGSTPWGDPSGTYGSNDWRKTDIDVWYPADSPEELGLRGSTDQPNSIVHVFPRMPVSVVCWNGSGGEGCMRVSEEEGGGVTCACEDRYSPGCKCAMPNRPQYFACKGGFYDGMPCTRHAHCESASGNSGTCSQKPICRPNNQNGIWQPQAPGTPSPTPGPTRACWDDDDCTQHNFSCGYRLFDLKDRQETRLKGSLRELDAKIEPNQPRARRGVCKNARNTVCNNNPAKACPANQGACRGFTLRAEGKLP